MNLNRTACLWLALAAARAQGPAAEPDARVALRVEPGAVVPGRPITLGIELQVPPGWHTYWENPGDTGMAPEFRWTLPDGVRVARVRFPVPSRIAEHGLVTLGYAENVCLLADCETGPALVPGPNPVSLAIDWMICRDVCVPVASTASAVLWVGEPAPPGAGAAGGLARWRARLPRPAAELQARAWRADGRIRLRIEPVSDSDAPVPLRGAESWIFPRRFGMLELGAPPAWTRAGRAWVADLAPGPSFPASGGRLDALWVVPGPAGAMAWELEAEVGPAP